MLSLDCFGVFYGFVFVCTEMAEFRPNILRKVERVRLVLARKFYRMRVDRMEMFCLNEKGANGTLRESRVVNVAHVNCLFGTYVLFGT